MASIRQRSSFFAMGMIVRCCPAAARKTAAMQPTFARRAAQVHESCICEWFPPGMLRCLTGHNEVANRREQA
jgi:hypothetical protein